MPETTLNDWLRRRYPQAKLSTLRRLLDDGRVRVNGEVVRHLARPLISRDQVFVTRATEPAPPPPRPPVNELVLVYDDPDFLVVDKPAGLLTSTVPGERRPTVLALVRDHLADTEPEAKVGLIHRLDRDASGLLIFSKTPAAYDELKTLFFRHTIERVYAAVTHGTPTPAAGRILSNLVELPDGSIRSSRKPNGGRRSVTDYATVARVRGTAAVRVQLETGRKHQIRVHLAERGVPIVGDKVYGRPDGAPRMMLAAVRLGFDHPRTGEPVVVEIPVPDEFPLVGGIPLPTAPTRSDPPAAGGSSGGTRPG